MEEAKIINLYNLDETIAKELLEKYTYPWEVLAHIETLPIFNQILQILKSTDVLYDKTFNRSKGEKDTEKKIKTSFRSFRFILWSTN